jgi:hypothetical protein
MSARDAIIDEIKTAPESLVREAYDFILFLKQRKDLEPGTGKPQTATARPDFFGTPAGIVRKPGAARIAGNSG